MRGMGKRAAKRPYSPIVGVSFLISAHGLRAVCPDL